MMAVLRLLISKWFIGLVLVLVLSALVWLYGPRLSFDDVQPFASEISRLIVIVVLLVIWGVFSRLDAKPKAAPAAKDAPPAAAAVTRAPVTTAPGPEEKRAISREIDLIRREFTDTMRQLRRAAGGFRFGGGWRYQLPWYLLVGGESTGKSGLLSGSGLSFPLRAPGDLPLDGPRDSIWAERVGLWVAEEAVFVEPPGDLVRDAGNQTVAGAVWGGFLDTIRRSRPRQPLNGVILTVALPELLTADEGDIRDAATQLRHRLRDIRARTGIRLPVYLVLTQTDRLAGFDEFFDELPRDARDQILGITLEPPTGAAGTTPLSALEPGFDELLANLNARVMERLHREPDIQRRGLSFGFPQQLAMARGPLRLFVDTLFRTNRYEEAPLARGVYFTSTEQAGSTVDLMRSLTGITGQPVARMTQGRAAQARRPYFTGDLLRRIILPEAQAAGLDPRHERRRRGTGLALSALVAALVIGLMGAWFLNLTDSRRLLDAHNRSVGQAGTLAAGLIQSNGAATEISDPAFPGVNRLLDELRTTSVSIGQEVADRPWRSHLGLYRGTEVATAADRAYADTLRGQFLPRVLLHLEQRIADPAMPEDRLYALLRAYLMLGGQGPFDRDTLQQTMIAEWADTLPGRENLATRNALAGHLAAMALPVAPAPELREGIVLNARARLTGTSHGERGMELLLAMPEVQRLPVLRLSEAGGPLTQQALVRRSGASLQEGIPGLYTARGFQESGKPAVGRVAQALASEAWVLGAGSDSATIATEALLIREDILQVYAEHYIRHWETVLADLGTVPMDTVERSADVLSILGGSASPLRRIYMTAASETNLMALPEETPVVAPQGLIAAANTIVPAGAAAAAANTGLTANLAQRIGLTGAGEDQVAERLVTDRFAPLRELMGENGDGPEISALIARFADMAQVMTGLAHGTDPDGAFLALLDGSASGGVPAAAGLEMAAVNLPAPLNTMTLEMSAGIGAVGTAGAQQVISALWAEEVLPVCTAIAAGRYPVAPGSSDNISVADFSGLYGPDGLLAAFFAERLEPLVDTSRSPWRWRQGRGTGLGLSDDTPAYFETLHRMRAAVFPDGAAAPTVRFQLRPRTLDAAADRIALQMGEASLQYAHGVRETTAFEWVAADDSMIRLFMTPPLPGQPDAISATGPWSLFALLRQVELQGTDQPDQFILRVALGDRVATFELMGSSIGNPFGTDPFAGIACPPVL